MIATENEDTLWIEDENYKNSSDMEEGIDNILEDFHLGKIDLIEVKKQLLILYSVVMPRGTLCVCEKPNSYPKKDLCSFYCTKCGKDFKHNAL